MFTGEWKWHIFTFRSAFGKYGPMNIEPPLIFYSIIGRVVAVFAVVLFAGLLRRRTPAPPCGDGGAGLEAALLAVFLFLTVFQSFWHSWTADFQPQGRYLFPILAMTACALIRYPTVPARFRHALWWSGLGLWGLSMWSFVAVGLARIAR